MDIQFSTCNDLALFDNTPYKNAEYINTAGVLVWVKHTKDGDELNSQIVKHNVLSTEPIVPPIKSDGYYTIYYTILPLKDYTTSGYFIDDDTIYKYTNDEIVVVQPLELIEVNPKTVDFDIFQQDFIYTLNLKKCYLNLAMKILSLSDNCNRCHSSDEIKDLIFRRDMVWMGLNVIQFLVEECNYKEAARIIYLLLSCNGFCTECNNTIKTSSCGCGR